MKKKLLAILLSVFIALTVLPASVLADDTFTVTYNANGGTGNVPVDDANYNDGDTVTVGSDTELDLVKENYTFKGWNTQEDGTGEHFNNRGDNGRTFEIHENTTLYAEWGARQLRIQISKKDLATGTVYYDFLDSNDESLELGGSCSESANVGIPTGAVSVTLQAQPGGTNALLDCTISYKDEDIDEDPSPDVKSYMADVMGDGYKYVFKNNEDIVFKAEFVEEIIKWNAISWGDSGNIQTENGKVYAEAVHVGEKTYSKSVETTDEGNNLYPISLISNNENNPLKNYGVSFEEGDLFISEKCTDNISIDYHFIPDYGYQVTDVLTNEENSLLGSFNPAEDEISQFTFTYDNINKGNVHFNVVFTSEEDIIKIAKDGLVSQASIENGQNAIESGNLQLEIFDVNGESISEGLAEAVGGNEAEYIQMNLSQVVSKAKEGEDPWTEEVTEFVNPIEVTIEVNDLDPMSDYYIVREHTDGEGQESYDSINVNRDGNNISFATNKFSTYALVKKPLEEKEFKVEYDERRDDEGKCGASVVIGGKIVPSLATNSFTADTPITFTLNSPDDRTDDVPFVEIEVFDGGEGRDNTMYGSFYPEGENKIELDGNNFTFTPEKNNPFIVRVIWSEYDWFGPEDGQYMIETNIFNNGTIVPSIDSVPTISHGYNQRKDCYTVGENLILTLVPGENVFGDEEELEFVVIGTDFFTKDGGEDEDEFTRSLSELWNEEKQCYQIIIEGVEEFEQWYIEAHFTGETYKIIEGKNLVININEDNDAVFVSNADISKFEKILIDGVEVVRDPANYVVEPGSTKVIIKSAYLNTLSVGNYVLEIVSTDGSASTKFTIVNESKPTPKPYYVIPKTGVN